MHHDWIDEGPPKVDAIFGTGAAVMNRLPERRDVARIAVVEDGECKLVLNEDLPTEGLPDFLAAGAEPPEPAKPKTFDELMTPPDEQPLPSRSRSRGWTPEID